MKRFITLAVAGALTLSAAAGQSGWAMTADGAALNSRTQMFKEYDFDLETGSMFTNSAGYWAGNVYVNEPMGISVTIPDSFTIMETESTPEARYLVAAADETTQEVFQLVSVSLSAIDGTDLTEQECLEWFREGMFLESEGTVVSENYSTETLAGEDYTVLAMEMEIEGQSGTGVVCCRIKDSVAYLLTAIAMGDSNEGVNAILDSVSPVESGIWNGQVYTNPVMDISIELTDNFTVEKDTAMTDGAAYPCVATDETTGSSIQIAVMDLYALGVSEEEIEGYETETMLNDFNNGFKETSGITLTDEEYSEVTLGQETFGLVTYYADLGSGNTGEYRSYGRLEDGYAIVIATLALDENSSDIDDVIDNIRPVQVGSFAEDCYVNMPLELSMKLTGNWEIIQEYTQEDGYDTVFHVGDYGTGENILFQYYDLEELDEEGLTVEEYADIIRDQRTSQGGCTLEDGIGTVMMGGAVYSVVSMELETDSGVMEQKVCYRIIDDDLYVLVFTATPGDYSDDYNSVRASMGWQ